MDAQSNDHETIKAAKGNWQPSGNTSVAVAQNLTGPSAGRRHGASHVQGTHPAGASEAGGVFPGQRGDLRVAPSPPVQDAAAWSVPTPDGEVLECGDGVRGVAALGRTHCAAGGCGRVARSLGLGRGNSTAGRAGAGCRCALSRTDRTPACPQAG